MARVSILIPCYNAKRWIRECIESALRQTHTDCEVIVVDDGSTDGSLSVIQEFGDQIRFETGPNRGGNPTRNRLLELATGEWLQYLDADDYLEPAKVAAQLEYATDTTDVVYSPTTWIHVESDGEITQRREFTIDEPHDPWRHLIMWILPQTGGALWRRSAVESVGGWKNDQPCCQEHELYSRLLIAGCQFEFCPTGGAVYRQWSTDTVCRRNPLQTYLKRLEIVQRSEEFLLDSNQLSDDRRDAIAHTRLECARSICHLDWDQGCQIAGTARRMHPRFRLPESECFPRMYRLMYPILGFAFTERIASLRRRFQS